MFSVPELPALYARNAVPPDTTPPSPTVSTAAPLSPMRRSASVLRVDAAPASPTPDTTTVPLDVELLPMEMWLAAVTARAAVTVRLPSPWPRIARPLAYHHVEAPPLSSVPVTSTVPVVPRFAATLPWDPATT